jgi:hypothetical protein
MAKSRPDVKTIELIADYNTGMSLRELGRKYKIDAKSVAARLRKEGVSIKTRSEVMTEFDRPQMVQDYLSGMTIVNVAEKHGCERTCVERALKKANVPLRPAVDVDATKIIELYNQGMTQVDIANLFGVSAPTIVDRLDAAGIEHRNPRKHYFDEHFFDVIDTEEKAYWLGFIYADGNVSRNGRTLRVLLAIKDVAHLEKLRVTLDHPAPLLSTEKNTRLLVSSVHMGRRLQQLGIVARRGTWDSVIPQIPDHLYNHVIRGIFDGDGSVNLHKGKYLRIEFLGQLDFLQWMKNLFIHKFHLADNPIVFPQGIGIIRWSGKQIIPLIDYLYHDATIFLSRKKDICDKWLKLHQTLLLA